MAGRIEGMPSRSGKAKEAAKGASTSETIRERSEDEQDNEDQDGDEDEDESVLSQLRRAPPPLTQEQATLFLTCLKSLREGLDLFADCDKNFRFDGLQRTLAIWTTTLAYLPGAGYGGDNLYFSRLTPHAIVCQILNDAACFGLKTGTYKEPLSSGVLL
jgi:hypothetical protein